MSDYLENPHRIKLGEAIRARRDRLGMTQEALAEKVGSGQSNIYRIESGLVSVGFDKLFQIAQALGMTVGELVSFKAHNKPGE